MLRTNRLPTNRPQSLSGPRLRRPVPGPPAKIRTPVRGPGLSTRRSRATSCRHPKGRATIWPDGQTVRRPDPTIPGLRPKNQARSSPAKGRGPGNGLGPDTPRSSGAREEGSAGTDLRLVAHAPPPICGATRPESPERPPIDRHVFGTQIITEECLGLLAPIGGDAVIAGGS